MAKNSRSQWIAKNLQRLLNVGLMSTTDEK